MPNSGRSNFTIGAKSRRTKATAGHSRASAPTRSGCCMPISRATRPPIELPTKCARLDPERVHDAEHDAGEVLGAVGRGALRGPAEARQVDRVDAVALAGEAGGGVEEGRLGRAEAVDEDDVARPSPIVRVEMRELADRDVVDAQQRRAAAGEAEHPLEADGEVEVAAHGQVGAARTPRCR